jgi:hypothetical protein
MPKRTRGVEEKTLQDVDTKNLKGSKGKVVSDCLSTIKGLSQCEKVFQYDRLLESRAACMYHLLLNKFKYPKNKIRTDLLTIPVICSFMSTKDGERFINPTSIENIFKMIYKQYNKVSSQLKQLMIVEYQLYQCNVEWNNKMDKSIVDKIKKNGQIVNFIDQGEKQLSNTLNTIEFYKQISGVIDRANYVVKGNDKKSIYFSKHDENKLSQVDVSLDSICAQLGPDNCKTNERCMIRKTTVESKNGGFEQKMICQNKDRVRRLDQHTYVYEDIFETGFVVYKLLNRYPVGVGGNAGIFQQYNIGSKKDLKPNGKFTLTFPPFAPKGGKIMQFIKALNFGRKLNMTFPNEDIPSIGVNTAFYDLINDWFTTKFTPLKIPKSSEIFITGVSLGGGLTTMCAYILAVNGYKNIHFYALGAPRVGNNEFKEFMEKFHFADDSANFVRYNGIIQKETFHLQADPLCKFPPKFANNPRVCMFEGGFKFKPVFSCFETQPDLGYTFPWCNVLPVPPNCENYWALYVHSMDAYAPTVMMNPQWTTEFKNDDGRVVELHASHLLNTDEVPCVYSGIAKCYGLM